MTCDQIQHYISDALNASGDLPAEIEMHLDSCDSCREAFDAMIAIDARLRDELPARSEVSPELHQSITARIAIDTRLREELPARPAVSPELHNRILLACRRERAGRFVRRAMAAAAVVAIAVFASMVFNTTGPAPVDPSPREVAANQSGARSVAWLVRQDVAIPSSAQGIQDRVIAPAAKELASLGRSARGTIESVLALLPRSTK